MRLPDTPGFFTCNACTLCNNPYDLRSPVAGDGPVPADIMFIGQTPGKVEQRTMKPFQGPAGHQLDMVIEECGLTRDQINITNVVKQRPDDGGKDRKPSYAEMAACTQWLAIEIATVQPKVIVCFGETAQQLAFPGLKPHQCQGLLRVKGGIIWLGTYHPAWILYKRDPALRQYLVDTVHKANTLAASSITPAPGALELMPGVTYTTELSVSTTTST